MKTTLGITVSIVMIFAAGGVAHADPNFSDVFNSIDTFRLRIEGSSIDNDGNFTENHLSESSVWNYAIDIEEVNRLGDDHLFLDGRAWHRHPSHSCDGAAGQTFFFTASLTSHTSGASQSHPVTIEPSADQAHGAHSDSPSASMSYDSGGTNLQGYTIILRIDHMGTLCTCGDGYVDVGEGEECDDGNANNLDGCNNNCLLPICGDSINDPDEECDDGNEINFDDCRNDCTLPFCGDEIVDAAEECDDGNLIPADGCEDDCTASAPNQSSLLVIGDADETGRVLFEVVGAGDGRLIGCAAFSVLAGNDGPATAQRLFNVLNLQPQRGILNPTLDSDSGEITLSITELYGCRVCEVPDITNCGLAGTPPQCSLSTQLGANSDVYGQLWDKAGGVFLVPGLAPLALGVLAILLTGTAIAAGGRRRASP
jgi:cysteine-rich repeat protein